MTMARCHSEMIRSTPIRKVPSLVQKTQIR
nr:MAG TPA: hypothetical protein [Caudoviricetes sp.]